MLRFIFLRPKPHIDVYSLMVPHWRGLIYVNQEGPLPELTSVGPIQFTIVVMVLFFLWLLLGFIVGLDTSLNLPKDDGKTLMAENVRSEQMSNRPIWLHILVTLPAYVIKRIGQFLCYGMALLYMSDNPEISALFLLCALLLRHTFISQKTQVNIAMNRFIRDRNAKIRAERELMGEE